MGSPTLLFIIIIIIIIIYYALAMKSKGTAVGGEIKLFSVFDIA